VDGGSRALLRAGVFGAVRKLPLPTSATSASRCKNGESALLLVLRFLRERRYRHTTRKMPQTEPTIPPMIALLTRRVVCVCLGISVAPGAPVSDAVGVVTVCREDDDGADCEDVCEAPDPAGISVVDTA